jgi:hypothetical protein
LDTLFYGEQNVFSSRYEKFPSLANFFFFGEQ